jgi:hypothetical protein
MTLEGEGKHNPVMVACIGMKRIIAIETGKT